VFLTKLPFKECPIEIGSRDSDWLRAGRLRYRSSSPGRGKIFLFSTSSRPVDPSSYPMGTGGSFPGGKAVGA
jgi:hypothetical protein